jgi:CDP-2,3-bis-(O-geranylgeranyl)-sn-glycerol synthase
LSAAWRFLPVLGAPALHGPVLALDLLASFKRPLDGGLTFRGRRLLGDNKTWRGALVMSSGTLLAAAGLSRFGWYRARVADPLRSGALVAFAVVAGELPNSFLKRQLDVAPGAQRNLALSVLDQADFVLLAAPLLRLSAAEAAECFAVVALAHLPINVLGRLIGARETAI